MTLSHRLRSALEKDRVEYTILEHPRDFTALETAEHTHTPGREFAKSVIFAVGDEYAMVVLPAHLQVELDLLEKELAIDDVRMASEEETSRLFPDCEVGAEPPFGHLYDLPVYLSDAMTANHSITFNGGTHDWAVRMAFADYRRLVKPRVLHVTREVVKS